MCCLEVPVLIGSNFFASFRYFSTRVFPGFIIITNDFHNTSQKISVAQNFKWIQLFHSFHKSRTQTVIRKTCSFRIQEFKLTKLNARFTYIYTTPWYIRKATEGSSLFLSFIFASLVPGSSLHATGTLYKRFLKPFTSTVHLQHPWIRPHACTHTQPCSSITLTLFHSYFLSHPSFPLLSFSHTALLLHRLIYIYLLPLVALNKPDFIFLRSSFT